MEDQKKYNFVSFLKILESNPKYTTEKERLLDERLSFKIRDCQVYSAEMYYLLIAVEFKDEGFINEYVRGYNDGKRSLKEEIKEDMSGLWINNSLGYTEKLRHDYFTSAVGYPFGYKQMAKSVFYSSSIDIFYKIGFASGIVNEIDLMAEKNPTLFYDYEDEKKDYTQETWFLTGLELANGVAYQLRSDKLSYRAIAENLGFKETDQNYFSQSIGSRSKDIKNVFNHIDRLQKIIAYCEQNKIEICTKFLNECTYKHPNEF